MFPANPSPFLRLLCALANGKPCVGFAATYLDAIPRLTCEHSSREAGLRQEAGGGVHATQPLPIQDTGLFIPQVGIFKMLLDCPNVQWDAVGQLALIKRSLVDSQ
jgi:hypothetical protein